MIIWATITKYYILNICESNPHTKSGSHPPIGGWLFCNNDKIIGKCIIAYFF